MNRCSCDFSTLTQANTQLLKNMTLLSCLYALFRFKQFRITAVSIFTHFASPEMMKEGRDSQKGELNQEIVGLNCEENIQKNGTRMVSGGIVRERDGFVHFPSPSPHLIWSSHVYKDDLQKTDKDPRLLIGHLINKGITTLFPYRYLRTVSPTAQILCSNKIFMQ